MIKNGGYELNLDDKIVTEHMGFYYLLTKIQLLILLGLNIFLKKY